MTTGWLTCCVATKFMFQDDHNQNLNETRSISFKTPKVMYVCQKEIVGGFVIVCSSLHKISGVRFPSAQITVVGLDLLWHKLIPH